MQVDQLSAVSNCQDAAQITPPVLGSQSQGSHALCPLAATDEPDCATTQSPTAASGHHEQPSGILRGPNPSYSPAQPTAAPVSAVGAAVAAATSSGAQADGVVAQERPALVIETYEEEVTAQLSAQGGAAGYDGPDDVTESGSVLNTSSAWRSVTGARRFRSSLPFCMLCTALEAARCTLQSFLVCYFVGIGIVVAVARATSQ